MFILVRAMVWVLVAWRWGDWRNWRVYHATILYIIMCDLLYNVLTYEHPMWEYSSGFFPNHVTANLFVDFVLYPPAELVYLSRFPHKRSHQVLWVLFWIILMDVTEAIEKWTGSIHYHNGWNIWWSSGFDVALFLMLRLHFKRPLWAYAVSFVIVVSLMSIFHIPLDSMR